MIQWSSPKLEVADCLEPEEVQHASQNAYSAFFAFTPIQKRGMLSQQFVTRVAPLRTVI